MRMTKKVKLLVGWVGWYVVALLFSSVVGLLTVGTARARRQSVLTRISLHALYTVYR